MPKQVFSPDPNSKPSGLSPATRAGNMVFVSGQVALDEGGKLVGAGDCEAQVEQVFKNLQAALGAAGAKLSDVVKITAFLVDRGDFPAYAAGRLRAFPNEPPASSTVIVAGLVTADFLVEVEAVAVV